MILKNIYVCIDIYLRLSFGVGNSIHTYLMLKIR